MWREIKKIIQQHNHFIITTHVNPDGDGIGAATALIELLLQMGKKTRLVCDSPISKQFAFLNFHNLHEEYDPNKSYDDVEVLIVLDTHRKERIGRLKKLLENEKLISICIDHHTITETFTPYTALDPTSCSVGAMVYTLYKESGFDLNIEAATGIYASIICDTGRFSYSSTSRKAHKVADECIKIGVDPDFMYERLFQHVSLMQIKMFAKALQNMETYFDHKVVIQQILQEDLENLGFNIEDIEHLDLEYMHEFNKLIEDVECVILLRELSNNQVRLSGRSKSNLDVGKIMKKLGGGGHNKAAGALIKGSVSEVKEKLLELLREYYTIKNIVGKH